MEELLTFHPAVLSHFRVQVFLIVSIKSALFKNDIPF
jgi:hypothetical protein